MNMPDVIPLSWKIGAAALLVAAVTGWHMHAVSAAHTAGVQQESTRRDGVDAINSARAKDELAAMNEKVLDATRQIIDTQARLQKLQTENDHEKAISSQRQSDLLAGRERLRILTTARHPDQAGAPASTAAATVDQGTGALADIDPGVAAGLDGIRERHNEAVRRLVACVAAYDAVKAAADSLDLPTPVPDR